MSKSLHQVPTKSYQKTSTGTPADTFLRQVKRWIRKGKDFENTSPLVLTDISLERLHELEGEIGSLGLKPRCTWDSHDLTATLQMPDPLHETSGPWLDPGVTEISQQLQVWAQQTQHCATPELYTLGSASWILNPREVPIQPRDTGVRQGKGKSKSKKMQQADNCLIPRDKLTKEHLLKGGFPTVMFEVALSQRLRAVLQKVWKWLWWSDLRIQAVVVYKLSYPIEESGFKAQVGIFVRGGENWEKLFPLDNCLSGGQPQQADQDPANGGDGNQDEESEVGNQEKPVDEEGDKEIPAEERSDATGGRASPSRSVTSSTLVSEQGDSEFGCSLDGGDHTIELRGEWVTVVDESADPTECTSKSDAEPQEASSDDFMLKFSSHDFVRACERNPDVDQRVIKVRLDRLKDITLSRLAEYRKERQPSEPPSEPPAVMEAPPAPPKATRKRPNPDPNDPHALERHSDVAKRFRSGGGH